MKFTISWLKQYLDTQATAQDIANALNECGLEVESVTDKADALKAFKVAYITHAVRHPNADRLQVCTVDAGLDKPLQVVCGAANARAGLKVALAVPGTYIPGLDMTIKLGKIRDVESQGMLCSENELGLADESEGIAELPDHAEIGSNVAEALGIADPAFEISVTPNRPDALGVYGIARDLAAKGLGTLKPLSIPEITGGFTSPVKAEIVFTQGCNHFTGVYIKNVKNCESPGWLKNALLSIGSKPISALVDITNYMNLSFARPLHAFDADKLKGDITVRSAAAGEEFKALDEKTYILSEGMTVISDFEKPVALAGIMGGLDSGCSMDTQNIFLESAYFDPITTALTGRKTGLLSDSRARFERGIDPDFTLKGLKLAADLIMSVCGGEVSEIVEAGQAIIPGNSYLLSPYKTQHMTGLTIPFARQKQILEDLGFSITETSEGLQCTPPSWRPDIQGSADLVEEIIRIYGIDNVPCVDLPKLQNANRDGLTPLQKMALRAKKSLAARGSHECVSYSFVSEKQAELFGGGQAEFILDNPISVELSTMRPSILPSLLQAVYNNQTRGAKDYSLFEVAPVYAGNLKDKQIFSATCIRAGHTAPQEWAGGRRAFDVFDAKADVIAVLEDVGFNPSSVTCSDKTPNYYHPGRSGSLALGKNMLAYFGEIHPSILKHFGIKGVVVGCEIFLDNVPAPKNKGSAKPDYNVSNFQAVERDFAFVVDKSVPADDVLKSARKLKSYPIQSVSVFDVYEGTGIADDKKSLAIRISVQPFDKTWTETDLENFSSAVIDEVGKATGAVLRTHEMVGNIVVGGSIFSGEVEVKK